MIICTILVQGLNSPTLGLQQHHQPTLLIFSHLRLVQITTSTLLRSNKLRGPAECQFLTRLRPPHHRLEPPVVTPVETMDIKNFSICLKNSRMLHDLHMNTPIPLRQHHPPTHTLLFQRHIISAPTRTYRNSSSKTKPDEFLNSKPLQSTKRHPRIANTDDRNASSSSQSQASFGDALDASRGMLAMSQDLTTPRNIYGPRSDGDSTDSYGFPSSHSSSHSSHSSISSASTYPYYGSSVDGSSVSDYSSQSDSMEPISSRTLPRPSGLINSNLPPAPPQSMMGQFNSKISSSTQKKHKCKVCDKRFTRPSSLQTHMYSHTGEKRASLDFMRPSKSLTFR